MKDKDIEYIKNRLKKLKEEREKYFKLKNRLEELENNPLVIEYNKLCLDMSSLFSPAFELNDEDFNEFELYNLFLSKIPIDNRDTNKIYVYLGKYVKTDVYNIDYIKSDIYYKLINDESNEVNSVRRYADIEKDIEEDILIPDNLASLFETTHKVIKREPKIKSRAMYDEEFKNIQMEFIREALNSNQEESIKKLLKK